MKSKSECLVLIVLVSITFCADVAESKCSNQCDHHLALASYYVSEGTNLTFIATLLQSTLNINADTILSYNKQKIPNKKGTQLQNITINVPFPCECIEDEFLGYIFNYSLQSGDYYKKVARKWYANLTTIDLLLKFNTYDPGMLPDYGTLNVPVTCSCGNSEVSEDFGLFITYPLRPGDTLESVTAETGLNTSYTTLLQSYNPGVNFSQGSGVGYIPGKDQNGTYPTLPSSSNGLARGVIAGAAIGGVAGFLLFAACIYLGCHLIKKKLDPEAKLPLASSKDHLSTPNGHGPGSTLNVKDEEYSTSNRPPSAGPPSASGLEGITVGISVEFSYEELATATDNFSLANKIGKGGSGSFYYAELGGEKVAIKKMDMQSSRKFLAELNVLTHVHHLNTVRLIGYCVEGSLFLVYEYIENGNLSQHLRGSLGRDPLPWSTRVQIALDSARGLEHLHEHTVPLHVHRDIKSTSILIDKNFHGKVANFGLTTSLTKGKASLLPTRLVGTFGYMAPEYAQYGDVSPKVDVYAFGVVLYELISAKQAVFKPNCSTVEYKSLVTLFEDALYRPDNPMEDLRKLVDPRLGDDYPLDSVWKVSMLARECTLGDPQLRPSMRAVVVALMKLSSTIDV
ncbi:hypothetical protein F2P56_022347 [Juglans regia]|uniref:non-specific serine/threonine protein kinase n=2 Tax=Juglans regia TaxID=51240 RepID=A0A2I4GX51_JUGRE|nr:lysM domain receptor-like kinase 3 [Juglans regia]KAF5458312.1 hypothetical protein F2P56_022347 [Juglans regia]